LIGGVGEAGLGINANAFLGVGRKWVYLFFFGFGLRVWDRLGISMDASVSSIAKIDLQNENKPFSRDLALESVLAWGRFPRQLNTASI
jgi:hypothetical protein